MRYKIDPEDDDDDDEAVEPDHDWLYNDMMEAKIAESN